ncbi:hypothetical protein [Marinobacter sp. F4216]|uniref:hypothetical protein n=1 Tax=Marinobacter sp. F4216 TaxID=2874281 RepID=UPI001CBE712B|nr:hypothetical protein [Marinobacter sp. F4216]MBZ2168428.1 hypothetical protein [Marinobacter sp. F4216]
MRVLFLQPKSYFEELGIDVTPDIDAQFGFLVSLDVSHFLKKFDLVVNAIDHDPSCRTLCGYARSLGIPAIFLMDGIFDLANAEKNPFVLSRVDGLLSENCYTTIFTPTKKHRDYIASNFGNSVLFLPKRLTFGLEEGHEKAVDKYKYLITSAKTAYFDDTERDDLAKILVDVIEYLDKRGESFALRIFDNYLLSKINASLKRKPVNIVDAPFSDVIGCVDAVISPPSSVLHTASLANKRVYILNFRKGYEDFLDFGLRFSNINEFKMAINICYPETEWHCVRRAGLVVDEELVLSAKRLERNGTLRREKLGKRSVFLNFEYAIRYCYRIIKDRLPRVFSFVNSFVRVFY